LEKIDPAQAWKTWKELSRAIRLRPLDGPDDILEKAEIIEDRLDDLGEARQELRTEAQEWEDRRQALELQIEVLNDLAQVQRGGDLQLQQRLHTLREDLGKAARRLGVLKGSLKELDKELYRLNGLVKEYNHKAAELRRREEENR
jgi:chromosome segregation ATPase